MTDNTQQETFMQDGVMVPDGFALMPVVPGYEKLTHVLAAAFEQAAKGKGADRHATGATGTLPWDQQPILANARQVGPGGPAMQVMKKVGESVTMAGNNNFEGAKAEVLGAIVYAAALYVIYMEQQARIQA